jgi:hypothetical protein
MGENTKMNQEIWRNDDFQVYVTVGKTLALADKRCLACKHATL